MAGLEWQPLFVVVHFGFDHRLGHRRQPIPTGEPYPTSNKWRFSAPVQAQLSVANNVGPRRLMAGQRG